MFYYTYDNRYDKDQKHDAADDTYAAADDDANDDDDNALWSEKSS